MPRAFNIFVQRGITGGFAAPTPYARYNISLPPNSDLIIQSEIRPHGKPSLGAPETKKLDVNDHIEEIETLLQLLHELPKQYPGAIDLYGRDTCVVLQESKEDVVQSGSFAGSGIVPPTEEQKSQFNQVLRIIGTWVGDEELTKSQ